MSVTTSAVPKVFKSVTTVAGISSDVTAVAADASDIGAVAAKATEIGRLGTADAVADMNTLGTADVVTDLNTLGTADVVTDMNTLGTGANVTAMATCATNEASINRYSDEYTISGSAPGSPSEGDLWYDSSANILKVHNGSTFVAVTSATAGITDIVDDTTPQLGGNLDLQSYTLSLVRLAAGGIYSNTNTISANATSTTVATENQFLLGLISITGTAVWTIAGNGELTIL